MSDEEIDLKELIMLFWKKRTFIAIISVISLIFGVVYTFAIKTEVYTSTATINYGRIEGYIPQEGESQLLSEIQFNSSIMNTYKNYMSSNEILGEALKRLDLKDDMGELIKLGDFRETLTFSAGGARLGITAENPDEEVAIKIVNQIVDVFIEKSADFYQIKHAYTISYADETTTETESTHVSDIIVAGVVGLVISLAILILKFLFDPKISSKSVIENKLGLSLISSLELVGNRNGQVVETIENSEQFKVLRANIEFSTKNSFKNKTYFITSANENDGKTFASVNLAIAFSEIGKKVLVIDTDKKDGNLHKILGVENEYGLSNYLYDANKISEGDRKFENNLIQKTKFKNLSAVTIGNINGKKFEIIQNDKFIKFMDEMKEKFDIIILDGSEMIQYADSRFLSNLCDQTILIASINKTKESELLLAKKEIEKVKGNLLGIVLNYINKI
ncbi:MAG: polysaccharide biosynthesis tyrosine autokinase [Clostridia bacterium]|nr:polysaccharide biosynthesis tyrosine autokinase [Clostridia bacterium]